MSRLPVRCPGCGADVHPKASECPECGTILHRRSQFLPIIAGVVGVAVALLAGVGVWVALSPGEQVPAPQVATAPAPEPPPPVQAPSPPPETVPAPQSAAAASPSAPADEPLPLPHVPPGMKLPAADEPTRKEFARSTQQSFQQNGLDLKVAATGPEATVMNIAFTFPAKTAVELIASGPFPRQCKLRGFNAIAFSDSTGASWTYDLNTEKLTQK